MSKRIIPFALMAVVGCGALLVFWQPAALKTKLVNYVARDISASIPYEVQVGRVSGNVLTGFTLKDVRFLSKQTHHQILSIQKSTVSISWSALLFHKIVRIKQLTIYLDDGVAVIKGDFVPKPSPAGLFIIDDQEFPLDKFLALAKGHPLSFPLTHTGQWTIRKNSNAVTILMDGNLDHAPSALQGSWSSRGEYRGRFSWINIPLKRLWKTPPQGLETVSLHVNASGQGMDISGTGRLTSALADVRISLSKGVGPFQAHLAPTGFKTVINGDVNVIQASVQGQGSVEKATWKDSSADKLDFDFSLNPRNQRVRLLVKNLQVHHDQKNALDVESADVAFTGLSPRWRTNTVLKFADGSSAEMSGHLRRGENVWALEWQKFVFAFPGAGTWSTQKEGSLTVETNRRIRLRDLLLANGSQTLEVPEAVYDGRNYRIRMTVGQGNPEPWVKFFSPDNEVAGTVDSNLEIHGTKSDLQVDGFLKGHFPTLSIKSLGLAVHDIDMDIRASDRRIDIRRFAGKTKKGEIQITGGSQLPELDYSLRTRKVALEPIPSAKAVADVDLHLGGTLDSPALKGNIAVSEAVYTAPKKEKKKKATAQEASPPSTPRTAAAHPSGSLDVTVQWPRNVWYRDGISSIETRGDLRLQKAVRTSGVIVTGTITSLRGNYNYFGRNFNLDSGQIRFGGTPDINPLLNLEGSYSNGPTTVYLDITGTIKQPVLKMRSNPPLPDQDIVSVIVFGQPLSELHSRSGGTANNQEMMQAVGGVLGTYVAKGLNETGIPLLNFDMLNVQPADQGGSQVTVGRYLSRRLFISYGQTVQGSAEKSITADYFLTDKWTLQGASNSTEGNFMDFLFRYPLNKKGSAANTSPLPNSPFRNTLDQPTLQQQFRSSFQ